jgi:hypothetical protein
LQVTDYHARQQSPHCFPFYFLFAWEADRLKPQGIITSGFDPKQTSDQVIYSD